MPPQPADHRARLIAHAAATFEHRLLGRVPTNVSVVAGASWLVMHVHEPLSPVERRIARDVAGVRRVRDFHQSVFEESRAAFADHLRTLTGIEIRGGLAHVDAATGSIVKTFTTHPDVDLFLFGAGLPALGVPVDAHVHANDGHASLNHGPHGQILALGSGAGRP